jgi:hypothetical protein
VISFVTDPEAPADSDTLQKDRQPWKVTDAIRFLLVEAGVPEDEIDVPDQPLRFWVAGSEDLTVQYGADPAGLIAKLARDYLGSSFIRDPNAGPRGMWRLLRHPRPPFTNILADLYSKRPTGVSHGHPATRANAFGPNTVLAEAWETWVEGPELTHLTVEGITETGEGRLVCTVILPGWDDPASPNYTAGEIIPFTVGPETSLTTQGAVDWQARTILERVGARKWWRMTAALLLVMDPQDPLQARLRPLRVNDLGRGDGYPALVRSCDLTKKAASDRFWQMEIEGIFL